MPLQQLQYVFLNILAISRDYDLASYTDHINMFFPIMTFEYLNNVAFLSRYPAMLKYTWMGIRPIEDRALVY